jgi:hypothetical protein
MRHAGHFHGRYDKTEAFTKVAEEKGSLIPRQLPPSPMMIFARRVEHGRHIFAPTTSSVHLSGRSTSCGFYLSDRLWLAAKTFS